MIHAQVPDLVNGLFESVGGVSSWLSVRQLARDRKVRGLYMPAQYFYAAWGLWNLFYYPSLAQWLSFLGGILIVSGNIAWLSLAWKYRKC